MPEKSEIKSGRNYGIDLLRIVSMFIFVVNHTMSQSAILASENIIGIKRFIAFILIPLNFCAVNCYGLISGYVGIKAKHRYSAIALLWLRVLFYSVGLSAVCKTLSLFEIGAPLSLRQLLLSFFPIARDEYWYFSAYFGLFFIMPILNVFINSMNRTQAKAVLVIASTVLFFPGIFNDPFNINRGRSVFWLCILYLAGGCLARFELFDKVKTKISVAVIFALIFIAVAIQYIPVSFFKVFQKNGIALYQPALFNGNSPVIFFMSLFFVKLFAKMKIKSRRFISFISLVAPLTFGVYLFHEQIYFNALIIKSRFENLTSLNPVLMFLAVFGIAAAIFTAGCVTDFIREKIFKLLKIKAGLQKLENSIRTKISGSEA